MRHFIAARINVWLAPTDKNMRTNYVWTEDPKVVELADQIGWFAFGSNCIKCSGIELLKIMKEAGKEPGIGFEFFDRDKAKVDELIDFAMKNFSPSIFITKSYDGGKTWEVVQ